MAETAAPAGRGRIPPGRRGPHAVARDDETKTMSYATEGG